MHYIPKCKKRTKKLSSTGLEPRLSGPYEQIPFFLVSGLFIPLYWLYRPEITKCIFIGFGFLVCQQLIHVRTCNTQKWLFLAKNSFQFLAFSVTVAQSLRYCHLHNYGQWAFIWCRQKRPSMQRLGRVVHIKLTFWLCFRHFSGAGLALSPENCQVQNFS